MNSYLSIPVRYALLVFIIFPVLIPAARSQDEDYEHPFKKYFAPRSAIVEFEINAEGRAEQPRIVQNETALPEQVVFIALAERQLPKSRAGRTSRATVTINGDIEMATFLAPRPKPLTDGRTVYSQNEVDKPIPIVSTASYSEFGREPIHWNEKESAIVKFRLVINEKGRIETSEVIYASNEAAVPIARRSLKREKFKPAIKDGKPVCSYYDMTWAFLGQR